MKTRFFFFLQNLYRSFLVTLPRHHLSLGSIFVAVKRLGHIGGGVFERSVLGCVASEWCVFSKSIWEMKSVLEVAMSKVSHSHIKKQFTAIYKPALYTKLLTRQSETIPSRWCGLYIFEKKKYSFILSANVNSIFKLLSVSYITSKYRWCVCCPAWLALIFVFLLSFNIFS